MQFANCNITNNTFSGLEWKTVDDTFDILVDETLLLCLDNKIFHTGYVSDDNKWRLCDEDGCAIKIVNNVTYWVRINNPQ